MAEWDEAFANATRMKIMKAIQDAEREAYAAWRRGEPPPQVEMETFPSTKPKHLYQGNRKQRRAKLKGGE
jgi:hypothetical protein